MKKCRLAGRFVIFNEKNEILIVKQKHNWAIPGGGIDFGENLISNISRESEEELGINAEFEKVIFIQDFISKKQKHCMEFFCLIKNNKDFENVEKTYKNSSHAFELLNLKWVGINDFPEDFLPKAFPNIIKKYLKDKQNFSCEYSSGL